MENNFNNQEEKPKKAKFSLGRKIAMFLFLFVFIVSAGYLGYGVYHNWQVKQDALAAQALYEQSKPSPTPAPSEPSTPAPLVIRPEYQALIDKYGNDEIVGYLDIEGTTISYPVAQAKDNEYYLEHDLYKKPSPVGSVYLDFENDITKDDPNSIIYAHNMNNDVMFHGLRYFVDYEYYKQHPTITFNTLYEDQEWEIFSFMHTDSSFPYIQVIFPDETSFNALGETIEAGSLYDTGVDFNPGDRMLILSTCDNITDPGRFILCARLVTPEEKAARAAASGETPSEAPSAVSDTQ